MSSGSISGVATPPATMRKHRGRRGRVWFVVPMAVFVVAFSIYPLVQLVRMSVSEVTSATLQGTWPFVGLGNFVTEALAPSFWSIAGNTVVFVVLVAGLSLVLGFAAAVVLRGTGKVAAFVLGVMVFVWSLPPVVNGSVWKFLLNPDGPIDVAINALGMSSIPFLYDPKVALYSVAAVNTWAVVPFAALVFRAALLSVPDEVIEAARLDGASPRREIWHILLPHVRPTFAILAILTVVYAFRSFDFIFVMTSGGPGTSTNTLSFLSYSLAFIQYNYGLGAAVSIASGLLVVGLAVIYSRSIRSEEQS